MSVNDFMEWFGTKRLRLKQAERDIAGEIEKRLMAARSELREQTDAAIEKMLDEEIRNYAQELSEDEVKLLKDKVRDVLHERYSLQDRSAMAGFKAARMFKSARGRVVRDDAAALVVGAVTHGVVAMRKARKARLAWPPRNGRRRL